MSTTAGTRRTMGSHIRYGGPLAESEHRELFRELLTFLSGPSGASLAELEHLLGTLVWTYALRTGDAPRAVVERLWHQLPTNEHYKVVEAQFLEMARETHGAEWERG